LALISQFSLSPHTHFKDCQQISLALASASSRFVLSTENSSIAIWFSAKVPAFE